MVNIIFKIVKRMVIAICLLYALNLSVSSLNVLIPINLITLTTVGLLGIPGACTLVAVFLLI